MISAQISGRRYPFWEMPYIGEDRIFFLLAFFGGSLFSIFLIIWSCCCCCSKCFEGRCCCVCCNYLNCLRSNACCSKLGVRRNRRTKISSEVEVFGADTTLKNAELPEQNELKPSSKPIKVAGAGQIIKAAKKPDLESKAELGLDDKTFDTV